jgi:hypothetical protein
MLVEQAEILVPIDFTVNYYGGYLGGGGAGRKEPADAAFVEFGHVLFGDDTAAGEEHIVEAFFLHECGHTGENGHVGTGENGDANGIDILLKRSIDNHFGGLAEAGIDDLHARIAEGSGYDLSPSIVAIEAHFGYQYPDRALQFLRHILLKKRVNVTKIL